MISCQPFLPGTLTSVCSPSLHWEGEKMFRRWMTSLEVFHQSNQMSRLGRVAVLLSWEVPASVHLQLSKESLTNTADYIPSTGWMCSCWERTYQDEFPHKTFLLHYYYYYYFCWWRFVNNEIMIMITRPPLSSGWNKNALVKMNIQFQEALQLEAASRCFCRYGAPDY